MHSSSCKSHGGVREQCKGSSVHPLHTSSSYCRRPEEQDQLVCVFSSLLLLRLLRRSAGCEALLTSEASAPPLATPAARAPLSRSLSLEHSTFCWPSLLHVNPRLSFLCCFCCCFLILFLYPVAVLPFCCSPGQTHG